MIGPESMGGAAFGLRKPIVSHPTEEWWHESGKFHWRGRMQRYQMVLPDARTRANGGSRSYFPRPKPGDTPFPSSERGGMDVTERADVSIRSKTPDDSRRTGRAMIGPESMGGAAFGLRKPIVSHPTEEWWHESGKFHWRGRMQRYQMVLPDARTRANGGSRSYFPTPTPDDTPFTSSEMEERGATESEARNSDNGGSSSHFPTPKPDDTPIPSSERDFEEGQSRLSPE
jgi:hypothetical protein